MTRYYDDYSGEEMSADEKAREVLAPDEYADYAASKRDKVRSRVPRGNEATRIDDLGYDQWGQWHPEAEQA